ncbi:MAG: DUF418 domain-containing protein [Corynebacterium sp.]|uniref:DUF418 domain-containing protein n=1 Tax=Corynebacterium sp. TaxID=1720 RepID=UPI0026E092CB|nr:DUF418 domain-containing protein [Corynebacterium sp.]MDO5669824.1 DUF418 domain-containing protein [Corynebacterium sp.]
MTTSPRRRIIALDVLRGIAILGTLLTNIWIFSESAFDPDAGQAEGALAVFNRIAETGLLLFTDGKFIGLLTIMFGIGLEIQRQSALRRGESWPGRYPWRAGILILDGLLNYIFIFEFDVLMGYGLTALVVAAVMAKSPKVQKIWMFIGLGAHLVVLASMSLVPSILDRLWPVEMAELPVDANRLDAAPTFAGTESYWGMLVSRVQDFIGGRGEIPVMFVMGLGLFLVGAHLYRAGLFLPEGRRLRRIVMGVGFGVGFPVDWALRLSDSGGFITRYGTSTIVAFGLLAAVAAFYVHRERVGLMGHGLSLVGRMALTNYILQNLIASIIFYDWGFGVSAKIQGPWSLVATLAIYLGIAGFLITLSAVWLHFFRRGPVELVWHDTVDKLADFSARRREGRVLVKDARVPAPASSRRTDTCDVGTVLTHDGVDVLAVDTRTQ